MRVAAAIELSSEARLELEKLSRRRTVPVRVAQRSRIILLAAEGRLTRRIQRQCHCLRSQLTELSRTVRRRCCIYGQPGCGVQ